MANDENCLVCKGNGTIELLDSQCPFCNGTGEFTKSAESYLQSIYVNVFFLIERCVQFVRKNVIMILQTDLKF